MDKETREVLKSEKNEHNLAGGVNLICERATDEPNDGKCNLKQCTLERVKENDAMEFANVNDNSNVNADKKGEHDKTQAKCRLRFGIDAILKVTNRNNNDKMITRCEVMSSESETSVKKSDQSDDDVTDSDFDSDDGVAMMSNNIGISFNPGYFNLNSKLHDVHFQPMALNGLTSRMTSMTSYNMMPMMTSWTPFFLADFRKERSNGRF